MAQIKGLSAQDLPPGPIRDCYKEYSAIDEVDNHPGIIDLRQLDPDQLPHGVTIAQHLSSQELRLAFDDFIRGGHAPAEEDAPMTENIPVYSHNLISGLLMIPALFPTTVQTELLSRLFHRDLSNPEYQTNVHLHYDVTYPEDEENHSPKSFFGDDPTRTFQPKDPRLHEPLDVQSFLEKRLRESPPVIPQDIAKLLSAAFPETSPHAAIVDIHSTRDTQSIHREVTKDGESGLISVSFGCDGLFLASHDDGNGCKILRLRSGDTVYMNGASRFAWHGVPKILPSTCPAWLSNWPSLGENLPGMPPGPYQMWEGWMSGKRITLNVQQTPTTHASKDSAEYI
ncbi:uncharacterized protein N7446_007123 [Penicillium canescens]|uniref:Alpha-ketoglutarate-dependent dioxygenase AlkB-like domain-containing protein n=1 Tax=Penicillium canescens TaxID=5083 RepID=A0AAD6NDB7_PENCN|nr:uncharacterized protein N7446_007123 [Penicillium canescens]KAJ6052483.1 hypothetical protein N7460_003017 [Penicillium canescens]KAJ6063003.1 hypothetical protein N7446_007123 [Penicillium canescens]